MGKFDLILARCFYKFLFLERESFYAERRKKVPRVSDHFQEGTGSAPNVSGSAGGSFGGIPGVVAFTNHGEFNRHYHAHLLLCEL